MRFWRLLYTNNIVTNQISVAMNATLTNVSLYCTASKRVFYNGQMTSTDPPGIMFVEFFHKKYLPAMDT